MKPSAWRPGRGNLVKSPTEKKDRQRAGSVSWVSGMGGAQKYMGIGIQAGASVAFYLGMGLLLDKWLDTLPWLTLLGALIGIIAMFALFVRMNRELDKSSRQTEVEKQIEQSD